MSAETLTLCGMPPSVLLLRAVQPEDGAALQDYFRRLSPQARYFRLHGGASELPALELARTLAANGREALSLLLLHVTAQDEAVVGEARVALSRRERQGEFALSIADGWRRLGLGATLLDAIERLAAEAGAENLVGDILRDNSAMIALALSRGYELSAAAEARLTRIHKRCFNPLPTCENLARVSAAPRSACFQFNAVS